MSELYKAMKRIEDYQSTKPLYKQIAEIKGIASTARYGYDIQPQLTIRKSIADELDKVPNEAKEYVKANDFGEYTVLDDFAELRELYEAEEDEEFPKFMELKEFVKENLNLCAFYLAGKALGVDLVKVGRDEKSCLGAV